MLMPWANPPLRGAQMAPGPNLVSFTSKFTSSFTSSHVNKTLLLTRSDPKKVRKVGKTGHSITNNITSSLANIPTVLPMVFWLVSRPLHL